MVFNDPQVRAEYDRLHEVCPQCFNDNHYEQTTVGYPMGDINTDRDNNRVRCRCGFVGIVHDLVPRPEPEEVRNSRSRFFKDATSINAIVMPDGQTLTEYLFENWDGNQTSKVVFEMGDDKPVIHANYTTGNRLGLEIARRRCTDKYMEQFGKNGART